MKKRFLSLVLICMVLLMLHTTAAAAEAEAHAAPSQAVEDVVQLQVNVPLAEIPNEPDYVWTAKEKELLKLINEERIANGVSPVSISDGLLEAGDMREQDFISRYGYNRPNGTSGLSVLTANGIGYTTASELIAVGQATPQAVLRYWMNNEEYKAKILSPDFSHVGIGYTNQSCTILTQTGVGRIKDGWSLMLLDDGCAAQAISLSESAVQCGTESLDTLGLLLKETCSGHGICYLPLPEALCTGFRPGVPGEQVVSVSYKGQNTTLLVTVPGGAVVKYSITVGSVINGKITLDKTTAVMGDVITVSVTPNTGYRLAEILVDGKPIVGNTFTVTGDHVVTASFELEPGVACDLIDEHTARISLSAEHTGLAIVAFYASNGQMRIAQRFDVSAGLSVLSVESEDIVLTGLQLKVFLLDEQGSAVCPALSPQ